MPNLLEAIAYFSLASSQHTHLVTDRVRLVTDRKGLRSRSQVVGYQLPGVGSRSQAFGYESRLGWLLTARGLVCDRGQSVT